MHPPIGRQGDEHGWRSLNDGCGAEPVTLRRPPPGLVFPGEPAPTAAFLQDFAPRAEDLGFASLWVDHLFDPPPPYRVVLMEPLTTLALVVRAAKRVSLGTGILVPPFRHPVLTAKALATWVSRQRATSSFNLNMDDNLLRYQDNPTAIVPWLAETHEVVNAGRRWTFHLRHRVKPHDGSEASAEAVRFSFESLLALERFALRCSSVCG